MKKRGFTLIELLAVIVILAIIALIATPIIMNIIDRSKGGVYDRQRDMVAKSAELYYFKYNDELVWEDDISYVEIGRLKETGYLREKILNPLNNQEIPDEAKVLIYKEDGKINYSLQLYDNDSFKWYQQKMVASVQGMDIELPTEIGTKTTVDLNTLIDQGKAAEIRIPTDLANRCVGYVDIEKVGNDNYTYEAYVDCLLDASTFASHYLSYGGKYLDEFNDVIETSDGGYLAVGRSNSNVITKYGIGNNGKYDAIIVKFDVNGNVLWSKNFGGSNNDIFRSVVEIPGGYIAVGSTSSNDLDIDSYWGGTSDGLIVKYSSQGEVLAKRNFGTSQSWEHFMGVVSSGNSVVVFARIGSNNDGDMTDVQGLVRSLEGLTIKFDLNLEVEWMNIFTGHYNEEFNKGIKTSDNNYVITGFSTSKDYDMDGIGYTTDTYQEEAIIIKVDDEGNLVGKNSLRGSKQDYFYDVVEVLDGYIAVGYSKSSDQDMLGLSKTDNGYFDAVIVKYDKNLEAVLWKKTFGGSNDDYFYSAEKVNNNEVVIVGYSKSEDMDMSGITKSTDGYGNAILVKYDIATGNVISKKTFGGTNSDKFHSIVKTSSGAYVLSGSTYSNNLDLKNFNKGHQDAILVSYDNNFNLSKIFQEPVVLIDQIKPIQSNYGSNISLKYDNIYTSNDPTKDLLGWCNSNVPYTTGNTSNYYHAFCLRPFNMDDQKLLTVSELGYGAKMYQGEYEYEVINQQTNNNNWHLLRAYNSFGTGNLELSNLKLKFEDGYIGHITDAIEKGYIEPLVIVNSYVTTTYPPALYPNVIDLINEGGRTGVGSSPSLYLIFKPKLSKLNSIYLTSSKNYNNL
jgi:prepilin-type N-terminal cleavage/methylation domain-containing protein